MTSVDAIRTPDPLLEGLPDFPFAAHHRTVEGLRLAHVDEGDGAPVVFWHGEPTWSYLWRKVMPPVRDAGYRVIAPDLVGFGRSDKPTDLDFYTYDRHCAMAGTLLSDLDLRGATFVVHDWGGPIGLRVAMEHADRVDRIVLMDTGLWTGTQPMSETWQAFVEFTRRTEDLPIGMLVRRACKTDPGDEVVAGYDAPFVNAAAKAGARAFPLLVPQERDAPGAAEGRAVLDWLGSEAAPPKLMLWADSDPVLPLETGRRFAERIGAGDVEVIPDAGHFLQEDQGPLIGERIADWLGSG